ncbi:MAG: hypothetical protein KatS3mg110_4284 [Pirellulaceae bacterium]|nr:MAG: hypothetical protein KatS3mg110_4284 [Pirellulaceae bacterium]
MNRTWSCGVAVLVVVTLLAGTALGQFSRGDRDRGSGDERGREGNPGPGREGFRGGEGFGGFRGGEGFGGFRGGEGFGGFRGGFPGAPEGPFPGGGFPGGRGGPPGGGPPGGGPFGGGPPGGFFGGSPVEFLQRFDRNGNGILEPDETEGRARFFLERMTSGISGVDLDRPIPIDRLARALERMRDERSRGESRGDREANSASSSGSGAEPLVPGFDIVIDLPPVPGFGSDAAAVLVKIEEGDRRQAEERMRRYDRNVDGFLSKEELQEGRWSDDPMQYDRNRDGRLSVDELAMRYARRRINEASSRSTSSNNSSSAQKPAQKFYIPSSSSGSGSGAGTSGAASNGNPPDERAVRVAEFMMRRMDANGNGRLERDEWGEMIGDGSSFDLNRDGVIDRDEMVRAITARSMGGGFFSPRGDSERGRGEGGDRGGFFFSRGGEGERRDRRSDNSGPRFFTPRASNATGSTNSSSPTPVVDLTQNRLTPLERLQQSELARELPDWFFRSDADQDGQIAMHEFSASWSDEVVADYFKFDLNQDGVITAQECVTAVRSGATRSAGSATSQGGGGFFSRRSSDNASASSSGDGSQQAGTNSDSAANAANPSSSTTPSSGSSGADRYLQYAQGIIRKYDRNRDGVLDRTEWTELSGDPSRADQDGDGKITAEEYARFLSRR